MITLLIIRDPQRFVQCWLEGEKHLAQLRDLYASLAKPVPEPERIPARLQKAIDHAEWELNLDILTASYRTRYRDPLLGGDFIAAAHQRVNDWAIWTLLKVMLIQALPTEIKVGTAAKRKARRMEREYQRLYARREAQYG